MHQVCLRCSFISRLQDTVSECDRADIFHSANAIFWTINHVILCKGEVVAEEGSVESNSFCYSSKDLFVVDLIKLALADEDSHLSRSICCLVNDLREFTCAEAVDIGAYRWTLFEVPQDALLFLEKPIKVAFSNNLLSFLRSYLLLFNDCLFAIRYDVPVRRGDDDGKFKRSSHAWLIKTGEEAMAEVRLTVRKDVNLLIFRILVEM